MIIIVQWLYLHYLVQLFFFNALRYVLFDVVPVEPAVVAGAGAVAGAGGPVVGAVAGGPVVGAVAGGPVVGVVAGGPAAKK